MLFVGGLLGQPTYKLWFRNPFPLFGSTIQRHISVMQPAVLREENTGDQMSYTYLSQPGGAHILLVMRMQRKVPEKWSPLRGSHCPATTAHYGSDEQIVRSQPAISGTITNTKYEKKNVCMCWGGWSYKSIGYRHLQMFSRTIKSDCSGNWIRMNKYVY